METCVAYSRYAPATCRALPGSWALTVDVHEWPNGFVIDDTIVRVWIDLFDGGVFLRAASQAFPFHFVTPNGKLTDDEERARDTRIGTLG